MTKSADGDAGASATPLWSEVAPSWLESGGLLVVPYDKDELNHAPALREGHGAHYAVLMGFARKCDDATLLLGTHGLSRRPLVMSASELHASNTQLRHMKRTTNSSAWVLGAEGMRLADRALFVWPRGAVCKP